MAPPFAATKIPGIVSLRTLARSRGWPYVVAWGHRIAGVLLAVYVCLHIVTLSGLRDPAAFESKMAFFAAVLPLYLEWLLAVPVIFHSLNGGRLILYEIFGNRRDRVALHWVLGLSSAYLLLLGLFMALGNQSASAIFFWVYLAAASGLVTALTVLKIKSSGASLAWKFQRISGAFLVLMIPAHMLYMHLDPTLGRDAQVITARMGNGFIKLVDILLVVGVLYHGGYGMLGICRDYLSSARARSIGAAVVVLATAIFAWMGVKLAVLI